MLRSLFGRAAEDDADAEHFDHWQTTDLCWSAGAERRALARWRLWGRRMGGERKQVRKSPRRLPAAGAAPVAATCSFANRHIQSGWGGTGGRHRVRCLGCLGC